jgi:hypothetical protein
MEQIYLLMSLNPRGWLVEVNANINLGLNIKKKAANLENLEKTDVVHLEENLCGRFENNMI